MLSQVHIIENGGLSSGLILVAPAYTFLPEALAASKSYLEIPSPGKLSLRARLALYGRSAFPGRQVAQRAGSLGQAEL